MDPERKEEIRSRLVSAVETLTARMDDIHPYKEPRKFGETLLSLGRALRNLDDLDREDVLRVEESIDHITEAVNIFNKGGDDHLSSLAHYELALSYLSLSRYRDKQSNTDIAIRALDEAKEHINYDDDPALYDRIEEELARTWRFY